jgi:hypothetical protein
MRQTGCRLLLVVPRVAGCATGSVPVPHKRPSILRAGLLASTTSGQLSFIYATTLLLAGAGHITQMSYIRVKCY